MSGRPWLSFHPSVPRLLRVSFPSVYTPPPTLHAYSMGSGADFTYQFGQLALPLHLQETEDSWQKIDAALAKLDALTKSGAYKLDIYVPTIKEHSSPIVHAVRTNPPPASFADLLPLSFSRNALVCPAQPPTSSTRPHLVLPLVSMLCCPPSLLRYSCCVQEPIRSPFRAPRSVCCSSQSTASFLRFSLTFAKQVATSPRRSVSSVWRSWRRCWKHVNTTTASIAEQVTSNT